MIIAIYETKSEIGYATRPLWNKIKDTKSYLRVLFTHASNEILDGIDELNIVNQSKCANMLRDILNTNKNTFYMN